MRCLRAQRRIPTVWYGYACIFGLVPSGPSVSQSNLVGQSVGQSVGSAEHSFRPPSSACILYIYIYTYIIQSIAITTAMFMFMFMFMFVVGWVWRAVIESIHYLDSIT